MDIEFEGDVQDQEVKDDLGKFLNLNQFNLKGALLEDEDPEEADDLYSN